MSSDEKKDYIGYEYKEAIVRSEEASLYLDCYETFGWVEDENVASTHGTNFTTLRLKRDRKIINKTELTRLQQHFEACANEIEMLERQKTSSAMVLTLTIGMVGTVFMAGSTFSVVHEPPIIWLCILLAIPGFVGWILPYYIYKMTVQKKTQQIQSLIEAKREEIYDICEKGHSLL